MRPVRGLCEAGKTVRKTEPRRFLDWQRRWPNNGEVSVVDDIKLALLGNQEAAKRLTDAGVLLPCPGCRGEDTKHRAVMACVMIECLCGFMAAGYDLEEARQIWNTRAPILSAEEMEMLEALNDGKGD